MSNMELPDYRSIYLSGLVLMNALSLQEVQHHADQVIYMEYQNARNHFIRTMIFKLESPKKKLVLK